MIKGGHKFYSHTSQEVPFKMIFLILTLMLTFIQKRVQSVSKHLLWIHIFFGSLDLHLCVSVALQNAMGQFLSVTLSSLLRLYCSSFYLFFYFYFFFLPLSSQHTPVFFHNILDSCSHSDLVQ